MKDVSELYKKELKEKDKKKKKEKKDKKRKKKMASGDPVVQVLEALPPATLFATYRKPVGGSTPNESVRVIAYDASTIEYFDFLCRLHNYSAGGLTFRLFWSAASATSGVTRWEVAVRRFNDNVEDLDDAQTYVYTLVDSTAPTAVGRTRYATVALTDGAAIDSWASGEIAIVRIRRNAADAADTMTGDAYLWTWTGEET
jgi:hypothetical protein